MVDSCAPTAYHYKGLHHTCLSCMTWLASNCIGNGTPSSEANEDIGDNVPLLKITFLAGVKSENACKDKMINLCQVKMNLEIFFPI